MNFPYWQDYPLTLANANDIQKFDAHGAWVACYSASEEFEVSVNGSPWLKFNQGLRMGWPEQGVNVQVRAKPGAAVFPNTIILRFGVGEYSDLRFSLGTPVQIAAGQQVKATSAATLSAAAADVVLVAATNTLLVAANAARREVRVKNLSNAVVRLSSIDAELTAGKGYYLDAYAEVSLAITGALRARSAGTPTLNVSETIY
ncbi:MAG: hypothetical protein C0502_05055 [Opitutus sp.]|nr:hypothetical protein [Opitutus sp.]